MNGYLLAALVELKLQAVLLWPNIDAGSEDVARTIRKFRSENCCPWLRVIINLLPEDYLNLLSLAACAVGNSSSFVRDAGYFGTPVVIVGDRQDGRERGDHVSECQPSCVEIVEKVASQLKYGRYPKSQLYGDGTVSERITNAIVRLRPYRQKHLAYGCEAGDK